MDQEKIGAFLRELRKEKGKTQEEIAEIFHVSNRTVSRWENGNNMPDLDILIEISDYYNLDLRELLDGERSENMNKETKETVLKAVDYTNTETESQLKRLHWLLRAGAIFWFISKVIPYTGLRDTAIFSALSGFVEGAGLGILLCGLIFTSRYGQKIRAFKERLLKKISSF